MSTKTNITLLCSLAIAAVATTSIGADIKNMNSSSTRYEICAGGVKKFTVSSLKTVESATATNPGNVEILLVRAQKLLTVKGKKVGASVVQVKGKTQTGDRTVNYYVQIKSCRKTGPVKPATTIPSKTKSSSR
jgi:hypothetical protein